MDLQWPSQLNPYGHRSSEQTERPFSPTERPEDMETCWDRTWRKWNRIVNLSINSIYKATHPSIHPFHPSIHTCIYPFPNSGNILKDAGHIVLVTTRSILKIKTQCCTHKLKPHRFPVPCGVSPPFGALLGLSTTAAPAVLAACPNGPTDLTSLWPAVSYCRRSRIVVVDCSRLFQIVLDCCCCCGCCCCCCYHYCFFCCKQIARLIRSNVDLMSVLPFRCMSSSTDNAIQHLFMTGWWFQPI